MLNSCCHNWWDCPEEADCLYLLYSPVISKVLSQGQLFAWDNILHFWHISLVWHSTIAGIFLCYLLSFIFLNSVLMRYPLHIACVWVMRLTSFSSLISSSSPRRPALKNTWNIKKGQTGCGLDRYMAIDSWCRAVIGSLRKMPAGERFKS